MSSPVSGYNFKSSFKASFSRYANMKNVSKSICFGYKNTQVTASERAHSKCI